MRYIREVNANSQTPFLDLSLPLLSPPNPGPNGGVPLGGIGGGCIGRGWRGSFRQWSLFPGKYEYHEVIADQFSIHVSRPNGLKYIRVLSIRQDGDPNGGLKSWKWGIDPKNATYYGLNPRAWTVYNLKEIGIRAICRQISPVIPHNYNESSLPTAVFSWKIQNLWEEKAHVSIMFTFQNGTGSHVDYEGGHSNHFFTSETSKYCGIQMKHVHYQKVCEMTTECDEEVISTYSSICGNITSQKSKNVYEVSDPASITIAARQNESNVNTTYMSRFIASGSGSDIWESFSSCGKLTNYQDEKISPYGSSIGAGICQDSEIDGLGHVLMDFSIAWDIPIVRFGGGKSLARHYTQFYGTSGKAGPAIAIHALESFSKWEEAIHQWQKPILDNDSIPDWYKSQLFNELYFIVNGGTVWSINGGENFESEESNKDDLKSGLSIPIIKPKSNTLEKSNQVVWMQDPFETRDDDENIKIGHFLYLEGQEYLMYNTYDVHFYASFALIMLWPKLQLSLQSDFAQAVLSFDNEKRNLISNGKLALRKLKGVVPHDVGSPGEEPWNKLNSYIFQDVGNWKDLGPKFILSIYRDYIATQDLDFLHSVYPVAKVVMEKVAQFDKDGDGLIENEGFPDQTYDIWTVNGPSAYTGGLWLGSLSAMIAMAKLFEDEEIIKRYSQILLKGKVAYEKCLWNGKYYNYDCEDAYTSNSIMADQLAGQWYVRACGLPGIVSTTHAIKTLRTIYEYNVQTFGKGELGAVNGMRPDGHIDESALQSREVWTGTTYALSAAMIQESIFENQENLVTDEKSNLRANGFLTAKGIYLSGWQKWGYWFQTPEAWEKSGNYRSMGYMRPLSIWAMQWAVDIVPLLVSTTTITLSTESNTVSTTQIHLKPLEKKKKDQE